MSSNSSGVSLLNHRLNAPSRTDGIDVTVFIEVDLFGGKSDVFCSSPAVEATLPGNLLESSIDSFGPLCAAANPSPEIPEAATNEDSAGQGFREVARG
jgi:hypothetical protein